MITLNCLESILWRCLCAAIFVMGAALHPAFADDAESLVLNFEEEHRIAGEKLQLNGSGLYRYKLALDLYQAALYLPPGVESDRVLGHQVPRRLEFLYLYQIERSDLIEATEAYLANNVSSSELRVLRPKIDRLQNEVMSVQPGDRYALTYAPDRGTELSLNGELLVRVPGADFAEAYFSIWLGAAPMSGDLKLRLLGKATMEAHIDIHN